MVPYRSHACREVFEPSRYAGACSGACDGSLQTGGFGGAAEGACPGRMIFGWKPVRYPSRLRGRSSWRRSFFHGIPTCGGAWTTPSPMPRQSASAALWRARSSPRSSVARHPCFSRGELIQGRIGCRTRAAVAPRDLQRLKTGLNPLRPHWVSWECPGLLPTQAFRPSGNPN